MLMYILCSSWLTAIEGFSSLPLANMLTDVLFNTGFMGDPDYVANYHRSSNVFGGAPTLNHPLAIFFSNVMAANRFLPIMEYLSFLPILMGLTFFNVGFGMLRFLGRLVPTLNID